MHASNDDHCDDDDDTASSFLVRSANNRNHNATPCLCTGIVAACCVPCVSATLPPPRACLISVGVRLYAVTCVRPSIRDAMPLQRSKKSKRSYVCAEALTEQSHDNFQRFEREVEKLLASTWVFRDAK